MLRHLLIKTLGNAAREKIQDVAANVMQSQLGAGEDDISPCDVILAFALGAESTGVVQSMGEVVSVRRGAHIERRGQWQNRRVVVVESGVGATSAAKAIDAAIKVRRPAWVVSTGFAGALTENLHRGAMLMADNIANEQGQEFGVGLKLDPQVIEATKGLFTGRLLMVDRLIGEPEEKRQLHDKHNAVACDMESYAVAEVCRQHKVRFLSVRVISDAVDDRLPVEAGVLAKQRTLAGKIGATAGAVWNRPESVQELWKLKQDAAKVASRLARFLEGVLPQLDVPQQPTE